MIESWQSTERHSWVKSLFLHLAPGVPFTIAFWIAAWRMSLAGGSSYLAIIICIPLVLAPLELGILLLERKRLGWTRQSLVAPRGSAGVSIPDILLSVAVIYLVAQAASGLAVPFRAVLLNAAAGILPAWAILGSNLQGVPPSVLWLGLLCSGVIAPVVEELYFRAYLLPRIPASGQWAPAVNAALHAVYHFYAPWNWPAFFLGFLPLAYYVRLRGNVLPTILTHMLFNSVGVVILLAGGALPY